MPSSAAATVASSRCQAVARRAVAGSDRSPARRAGALAWAGRDGFVAAHGRKVTSLVSAMQQERVVHQEWRVDGERLVLGGFSDAIYIAQPTSEMCETAYQLVRLLAACIFEEARNRHVPRAAPADAGGAPLSASRKYCCWMK